MGRPASDLQNEFPNMDWSYFHNDPNTVIWWYDPTIPTPFNTNRKTSNITDGTIGTLMEASTPTVKSKNITNGVHRGMDNCICVRVNQTWYSNVGWRHCECGSTITHNDHKSTTKQLLVHPENPKIINVLTIGHWGVYKYFTHGMEMENCQVSLFEL